MIDQILTIFLTLFGLIGFELAGRKVWWAWYINIANQALWLAFSIITGYYAFIVGTFFYFYQFSRNAYKWTKEHFDAKKPNRENYCYGSWDGDNWVSKSCTVPRVPHAPHPIPEADQGWDFNRVALPHQIELYDAESLTPEYETISLEDNRMGTRHHKTPKYEPGEEPAKQTPEVMCTGRPRHVLCEMPIVGHKPHMIRIPNTPEE